MKVALYARSSEELSTASKAVLDALEKLAFDIGASHVIAYRDVEAVEGGASGLPRFACLLSDLKAGLIDAIVGESLKRLADEEDLDRLASALSYQDIPVYTLAEGGISVHLMEERDGGVKRYCYVWYKVEDVFGPDGPPLG